MQRMNLCMCFSVKQKNCGVDYVETPQEMEISEDDEVHFGCAQVCHICQQIIVDDNDRVRDHCHFTGVYRVVAHNACNLNYRISPKSWKLPEIRWALDSKISKE